MTKLEQIARAMIAAVEAQEKASDHELFVCVYDERDVTVDGQVDFASLARAAVEAMREPTEAMAVQGLMAMWTDDLDPTEAEVKAGWRAMIDAILNEKDAG